MHTPGRCFRNKYIEQTPTERVCVSTHVFMLLHKMLLHTRALIYDLQHLVLNMCDLSLRVTLVIL